MKVVHVSQMDIKGGASRAGFGIFKALSLLDIEIQMIVQKKYGNCEDVFDISNSWLQNQLTNSRIILDLIPMYLHTHRQKGRFSFGDVGLDISKFKIIREADILHFHWINGGFLSMDNIYKLLKLRKPLFWTFHDMWAFTGGCHYSGSCERYFESCGFCPYLKKPSQDDYSNQILIKKKEIFRDFKLQIVTPSNWLKECALKSSLLRGFKINVIPYAVDLDLFKPQDKLQSRAELNFPKDKILILFGSMNISDERKGFVYFKKSLNTLFSKHPELQNRIMVIIFGKIDKEIQSSIPFQTIFCGRIESDKKLNTIYNSADFFVTSSIDDNYPNTVMESLVCGIPVIGFNTGGIPDMVNHLTNGYLAEPKNADSLESGMEWMINNKENWPEFSRNSREGIIKNNSPEIVGGKYLQLYEQALNKK